MTVVASNSSISQKPGAGIMTSADTIPNASHGYPVNGFSQDPYLNMFSFAKINVNLKNLTYI
jgi:hypothetical protein